MEKPKQAMKSCHATHAILGGHTGEGTGHINEVPSCNSKAQIRLYLARDQNYLLL